MKSPALPVLPAECRDQRSEIRRFAQDDKTQVDFHCIYFSSKS
jgi:hypothetical protein